MKLISQTLVPLTLASFSLYKEAKKGPYIKMANNNTKTVKTIVAISSILEIRIIEPNKYESKFAELAYFDKIPAIPIAADNTTTTPISENLENFFLNNSIIKKETTQTIMEINKGFNPAAKPIAIPANDEWAKASPEDDSLL